MLEVVICRASEYLLDQFISSIVNYCYLSKLAELLGYVLWLRKQCVYTLIIKYRLHFDKNHQLSTIFILFIRDF